MLLRIYSAKSAYVEVIDLDGLPSISKVGVFRWMMNHRTRARRRAAQNTHHLGGSWDTVAWDFIDEECGPEA